MMGGGGRHKNIFDLVSDPDRLKVHVAELEKATQARNQSIEEHKQIKADIEAAKMKLGVEKCEHEARQRNLYEKEFEVNRLRETLKTTIDSYLNQLGLFNEKFAALQKEKDEHTQHVDQKLADFQQIQQSLNQQQKVLDDKALSQTAVASSLSDREGRLIKREQFLINCANELTK